uniref:small monomeric GTPase n=1 Tax=Scleropages formosus TaxID=113540 RepID=A0A8C9W9D4_SCLFO
MSRKKAAKGKSSASSPCASPRRKAGGKRGKGGSRSEPQANGLAHPCRPPGLSSSGEFYDLAFKVMLVGDSGVGKTCLLVRFKDGAFLAGSFISTVGIDFRNKVLNLDGVKIKLQIWDTAGQERFRSVTHAYYRDAQALLLLYDVTNKKSFDNIQAWLTEIHEYAQQDVVLMLLGNKAEVTHERVVKREEGEKLAKVCLSEMHTYNKHAHKTHADLCVQTYTPPLANTQETNWFAIKLMQSKKSGWQGYTGVGGGMTTISAGW